MKKMIVMNFLHRTLSFIYSSSIYQDQIRQHTRMRKLKLQKRILCQISFLLNVKTRDLVVFKNRHRCYSNQMWNLSLTNLVSFMKSFFLINEFLCFCRNLFSSSHDSLTSISHLLFDTLYQRVIRHHSRHSFIISRRIRHDHSSSLEIFTYDRSSSFDAFVTIIHRFSKYFSRSLIAFRSISHDRSSSLDVFVTIVYRRSMHSSRSLIVFREFHSRSFDVVNHRSTSIEIVKNKFIEAREDFKRKVLSRFQTKDLFVRFVSTRYESWHSNILRLRFSIYILQHVSSHSITSILVNTTYTNICFLLMLMFWHFFSSQSCWHRSSIWRRSRRALAATTMT